jgi:RNA polymerase sigma factor (sigma-70 family)
MVKENTEELTLIQNTLNRNPQAEKIFYTKYRKVVKSYLKHKYPKLIVDIDDCVSDILIQVFSNLSKYDPEKSSVKTWILVIARHYMIDMWRCGTITYQCSIPLNPSFDNVFTINNSGEYYNSGYCTSTSLGNEVLSTENVGGTINAGNSSFTATNGMAFVANSFSISCNITAFENCSSLNHISNQLSPSDYTLLDMKYVQGYDYCEIGKEFNLTSNTVSNRVNYLKTKLKKNNLDLIYE